MSVIKNKLVIGIRLESMTQILGAMDDSRAAADSEWESGTISVDKAESREEFILGIYQYMQALRSRDAELFAAEAEARASELMLEAQNWAAQLPEGELDAEGEPDAVMAEKAAQVASAGAMRIVESPRIISRNAEGELFGLAGLEVVIVQPSFAITTAPEGFSDTGLAGYYPGAAITKLDDNSSYSQGVPNDTGAHLWLEKKVFNQASVQGWSAVTNSSLKQQKAQSESGGVQFALQQLLDKEVPVGNEVGPESRDATAVVSVGSMTLQMAQHQVTTLQNAMERYHKSADAAHNETVSPKEANSFLNESVHLMSVDSDVNAPLLKLKNTYPNLFQLFFVQQSETQALSTEQVNTMEGYLGKTATAVNRKSNIVTLARFFWSRLGAWQGAVGSNRVLNPFYTEGLNRPYVYFKKHVKNANYSDGSHQSSIFGRRANKGNVIVAWKVIGPTPYSAWRCWEEQRVLEAARLQGQIEGLRRENNLLMRRIGDLHARLCGGHQDRCTSVAESGIMREIAALDRQRMIVAATVRDLALAIANCGRDDHPQLPSSGIRAISDLLVGQVSTYASAQVTDALAAKTAELETVVADAAVANREVLNAERLRLTAFQGNLESAAAAMDDATQLADSITQVTDQLADVTAAYIAAGGTIDDGGGN